MPSSSSGPLPGLDSAQLARGAYETSENPNIADALKSGSTYEGSPSSSYLSDKYEPATTQGPVSGSSGNVLIRRTTGFGMLLKCKTVGQRDEYVLAIRGTKHMLTDGLTDINFSLQAGPNGLPVHSGFAQTYNSMKTEVAMQLRGKTPSKLHIVGHSLGGALANLFAAQYAESGQFSPTLATFGAPRVGTKAFADYISRRLGQDAVKRVYAKMDPIPMVPIWPFMHSQYGGIAINEGGIINDFAHFMESSYLPAMASHSNSWPVSVPTPNRMSVDYWLDRAEAANGTPFSPWAEFALRKALQGILLLVKGAGYALGAAALGAATLIDGLAHAAEALVGAVGRTKELVERFVNAALRFIGQSAVSFGDSVTVSFLKWLLRAMFQAVANMARRAINRLHS